MSATGLEVFDRTIQLTNIWLDDIMRELGWTDRQKAFHALRIVLQTLRDRLPVNDASHFAAQLPMLIRGLFFEGWHPAKTPVKERTRDEFLMHITDSFLFTIDADSRQIAAAVLKVVARHVSAGEVQKVGHLLPEEVRELWPVAPPAGTAKQTCPS
jgi:uncharacterized protein (DUF2267 family)